MCNFAWRFSESVSTIILDSKLDTIPVEAWGILRRFKDKDIIPVLSAENYSLQVKAECEKAGILLNTEYGDGSWVITSSAMTLLEDMHKLK